MSGGPDDFDLNAAWARRSQGDLKAYVEALAVRLEGALPARVAVERRRDGLLAKTSHVAKISVRGEKAIYELSSGKAGVTAMRQKLVRGVAISSAQLPVPEWLAQVREEVQALADQLGSASDVLHDFL